MSINLNKDTIKKYKNFLFDCDGVLWHESKLLPGAKEFLSKLEEKNKRIILITNNSTVSAEDYSIKCKKLDLDISPHNISCSAQTLARYLKSNNFQGTVYVIGEKGIENELKNVNIPCIGVGEENRFYRDIAADSSNYSDDVKAVAVGLDYKFNLAKLTLACGYILNRNCDFYATNTDYFYPSNNYVIPGTGVIVKTVSEATGKEPIVVGKPHYPTFMVMKEKYNLDPSETIMIGDTLETDIKFGNDNNMSTLLVFCGICKPDDLKKINTDSSLYPTYYCNSLADLVDIFD